MEMDMNMRNETTLLECENGKKMWWRKASDREEWRKLLMETKTLSCRAEDETMFPISETQIPEM
jgi:maltooligosyltrehalose synthase